MTPRSVLSLREAFRQEANACPVGALKTPHGMWAEYGEKLSRLGELCEKRGVKLAYHHHMGTVVETEADIDLLPEFVQLQGTVFSVSFIESV